MEWIAAIAPICGLILALIQLWSAKISPAIQQDKTEDNKEDFRNAASISHNPTTIEHTIDKLLPVQTDPRSYNEQESSHVDTARELSSLFGMAADGSGSSGDGGKGQGLPASGVPVATEEVVTNIQVRR